MQRCIYDCVMNWENSDTKSRGRKGTTRGLHRFEGGEKRKKNGINESMAVHSRQEYIYRQTWVNGLQHLRQVDERICMNIVRCSADVFIHYSMCIIYRH